MVHSQSVEPVIDTTFTFGGSEVEEMISIREMENRQVIMGGHTWSNQTGEVTNLNNGNSDYWIVRHDTAVLFNLIWDNTYGGDSTEIFGDMELLDDGYIAVGSSASGISGNKSQASQGGFDYWIIRCDYDGNLIWDRTYGGSEDDFATCLAVTQDGGYIVGGYSYSDGNGNKTDTLRGECDYWVVKLDAIGIKQWDVTLGGEDVDQMQDVYLFDQGYYCFGSSRSMIGGEKSEDAFGESDMWLIHIDDDGDVTLDKTYGGAQDDFGKEVIKQSGGPIVLGGTSFSGASGNKSSGNFGQQDCWFLQIDSLAEISWDQNYGGTQRDEFYDMLTPPEGGVVAGATSLSGVSGNKTSGGNGGAEYWIYKLDSSGVKQWDYSYGGSGNDEFRTINQGCDRGFLIGGFSRSNISGDKEQDSRGTDDYWMLRTLLPTHPNFQFDNVCYGTTVNFYDESDIWPDSWEWDFGDPVSGNNTSVDQHPLHDYSGPGDFIVTLFVSEGCQQDTFYTDTITIYENLILGELNLGDDGVLCMNQTATISPEPLPNGTSYLWNTGETTQSITVDSVGVYSLTIQNGYCSESDEIELAPCPIVYIPNAFTPDGDGINDVFYIYGEGIREMDLYIYNRWGEEIFHSDDQSIGWNGLDKNGNGKPVQIEVYPYLLVYRGLGTDYFKKIGHVTVIR